MPAGGEWARRKAEQAERTAAAMEDPVSRFYLLHGHPEGRQAPAEDDDRQAGDEDPGPA